jgi:hypothetical protein
VAGNGNNCFFPTSQTVARALQLLKGLVVKRGQERADRDIQLAHVEKTLVAQRRQNLPLGNLHADLGPTSPFTD